MQRRYVTKYDSIKKLLKVNGFVRGNGEKVYFKNVVKYHNRDHSKAPEVLKRILEQPFILSSEDGDSFVLSETAKIQRLGVDIRDVAKPIIIFEYTYKANIGLVTFYKSKRLNSLLRPRTSHEESYDSILIWMVKNLPDTIVPCEYTDKENYTMEMIINDNGEITPKEY